VVGHPESASAQALTHIAKTLAGRVSMLALGVG
jgi:ATP-binding protein involved in chromosome partitioning